MKKYIAIALLMVLGTAYPAYARWSVGAVGGGAAAAAPAGGPDAWYYSGGSDTYTAESAAGASSIVLCGTISVTTGGDITQLSWKSYGTTGSYKMGLYNTSGGRLTTATCTGSGGGYTQWVDCTLSEAYTVASSATVVACWHPGTSGTEIMYLGSTAGGYYATSTYANFPEETLELGEAGEGLMAVRVYVD